MRSVLLVQLPIPRLNYGRQTGNIPLGAACLKQAAAGVSDVQVDILPESVASYLGDGALVRLICDRQPDILGFTVYSWNVERSLYVARQVKRQYQPKIILGGPEITPDNRLVHAAPVDFNVYGEGEAVFLRLLQDPEFWRLEQAAEDAGPAFALSPSPYLRGFLEPEIENMMLLETQRGCPYHCAYCYYNKARQHLSVADEDNVLRAIRWAVEQRIRELFLLDPSLNVRPGLKNLLQKISVINPDRRLALVSEIRAEGIDLEMADLFAAAGFTGFEIGLQSTNPRALKIMNRPTNLSRWLKGAKLLQARQISPQVDLIAGLPGDDLPGFGQSVDFVADHDLQEDVQVFPLTVLPGTTFRVQSRALGLVYEKSPPYAIIATPTFSREDMLLAFDYAEVRFDVVLYPLPDLDIAWRSNSQGGGNAADHRVALGKANFVSKLYLNSKRSAAALEALAARLTHPYQIFVDPALRDQGFLKDTLKILTSANPFTPLEMVFLEPDDLPDSSALLASVRLRRPHFLDGDQRFVFPEPGNRAVLFTLVSQDR
ncbi:MAG: radical SAM protein, partial [Desulfobacterales bacterium]